MNSVQIHCCNLTRSKSGLRVDTSMTPACGGNGGPLCKVFFSLLLFVAVTVVVLLSITFNNDHNTRSPRSSDVSIDNDTDYKMQWPRHVISRPVGRLGNEMFVYAALLGIGAMNNMTPVYMGVDSTLDKTFQDLAAIENARNYKPENNAAAELGEYSNLIYDQRFERLHTLPNRDVKISTYFQSWKYCRLVHAMVRRAFTFRKQYTDAVNKFLLDSSKAARARNQLVAYVGVHIRRTDWVQYMPNHDVGGAEYYFRAVKVMIEKLKNLAPSSRLIFVVCSDDQDWARANLPTVVDRAWATFNGTMSAYKPEVVHSPGRSASEDMAMLASCNHTIFNIGTYGWWGAWLAGGVAVAYNKYPAFTPKLSVSFEDYYPADWIVIS